jgi:hypothetical protein
VTYEPFIAGLKISNRNFTVADPCRIRRIQRRARLAHERHPNQKATGRLGRESAARPGSRLGAVLCGTACRSDPVNDYADRGPTERTAMHHNEQRCPAPRMLRSASWAISDAASEGCQSSRSDLWPVTAFSAGVSERSRRGARRAGVPALKARSQRCLGGRARHGRTSRPANPDRRKHREEPSGGP